MFLNFGVLLQGLTQKRNFDFLIYDELDLLDSGGGDVTAHDDKFRLSYECSDDSQQSYIEEDGLLSPFEFDPLYLIGVVQEVVGGLLSLNEVIISGL